MTQSNSKSEETGPRARLAVSGGPAGRDSGEQWYTIEHLESMEPFLMALVSDEEQWMYIASNGGLTAGRRSAERAVFPYCTHDKLTDLAHTTGPLTWFRIQGAGEKEDSLWEPFREEWGAYPRKVHKKRDGTQVAFEELHPPTGLVFHYTWGFSRERGFVRRAEVRNTGGEPVSLEVLDGLQNLHPPGVGSEFQNTYSNLLDAYKRCEAVPGTRLRLIYLNSIPTDRAEPSESLSCTVVWSAGLPESTSLLSRRQLAAFRAGQPLETERESRGRRACALGTGSIRLEPGESRTWYFVADVGLSTAEAARLAAFLKGRDEADLTGLLEGDLASTSANLNGMVAAADGLQLTRDILRSGRHYSNALFNIMRGGVFPTGYRVPAGAFLRHLENASHPAARRFRKAFPDLPETIPMDVLSRQLRETGDPDLIRLGQTFLPLSFSRRHGDPSRPWNKFEIRVRTPEGEPVFAYQGNWRDIFQNWEALGYSFPGYLEGMVARFLNATTADGYNPYRLTSDGYEWEVLDPQEPWSNIGYWGDHQLVYLQRLMEALDRFYPERLHGLLHEPLFACARVPYRIRPYAEILQNPRESIRFDDQADAELRERRQAIGSDGLLLAGPDGSILHLTLAEKLLIPLLAKLGNFIPDGGIWMNTQRPEWNDANNALAGFGLSVVTLAHVHRYIAFLIDRLGTAPSNRPFPFSEETAVLLRQLAGVFSGGQPGEALDPRQRRQFLDSVAQPACAFRRTLYEEGLSGRTVPVEKADLLGMLKAARQWVAASLRSNQRDDRLFHSYNLLEIRADGGLGIQRLHEMLEGQVAILSADLLEPAEALEVLEALTESKLYRPDQDSYLLYPDRDLPGFLQKNRLPASTVAENPLLETLARDPRQAILQRDPEGGFCFNGSMRNGTDLQSALRQLPAEYRMQVEAEESRVIGIFEKLFNHHAFTGRSGTFFAYEGLGSIYWHMVSKLLLAVGEQAAGLEETSGLREAFLGHFRRILAGIGVHKSPDRYGAFPTDPYSHTPAHAGAQQPGMTGQVKEDLLSRWIELGIRVQEGRLGFQPMLLDQAELLAKPAPFHYCDVSGNPGVLEVPENGLAFTVCQVPVVYQRRDGPRLRIGLEDGSIQTTEERFLPRQLSRAVFERSGQVRKIEVRLD